MTFVIYQCEDAPEYFVVTDTEHMREVKKEVCPGGSGMKEIGTYSELGKDRVAFNETIAKDAIKNQGYYRFEAKTWDPVAQAPGTMP